MFNNKWLYLAISNQVHQRLKYTFFEIKTSVLSITKLYYFQILAHLYYICRMASSRVSKAPQCAFDARRFIAVFHRTAGWRCAFLLLLRALSLENVAAALLCYAFVVAQSVPIFSSVKFYSFVSPGILQESNFIW